MPKVTSLPKAASLSKAAASKPAASIKKSTSLPGSFQYVKGWLGNFKKLTTNIARSLTIFGSEGLYPPSGYSGSESLNTIVSINGLTIKIGLKYFTLVRKYVLFDRRYIDFNIYNSDPNNNAGVLPEHMLTAYASSSQVGAWRLCKTEEGNRLNKFDDYVQSTVIHVILAKFICEKFYTQELLWADEPTTDARFPAVIQQRNQTRNNLTHFTYNVLQLPVPLNMPQVGIPAAIPIYYVMEDRQYAYQTYPEEYLRRTQADGNITSLIRDRGLTEPCPFNYWINNGTCGDYITQGEPEIKRRLDVFSQQMDAFYDIETNGQGKMKITELYKDCMVYKNFKQSATIFKVRLTPKIEEDEEDEDEECNTPLQKQTIDIVFVQYTIKQWDERYEPRECNDPTNEKKPPNISIPGYYILTIIPTFGSNAPINFNTITDIGLFVQYIKAGFYACKPLDYKRQCKMDTFTEDNSMPSIINYEYVSIANRLNNQFPFYKLFSFNAQMREALKTYNENPIIIPGKTPILGKRTLTTKEGDMGSLQIDNLEDELTECPKPLKRTKRIEGMFTKKTRLGGTNKRRTSKHYRTNLQTKKIRKCKNNKKRTTKKQRITKKRRI
jgi:hypothetical protein